MKRNTSCWAALLGVMIAANAALAIPWLADLEVVGGPMSRGNLLVAGDTTLNNTSVNGTLKVTGTTTLGGTLGVTGATTLGGTLGVTGKATFAEAEINGPLTVKGAATFEENAAMKKDLSVAGRSNLHDTSVDGTLTVTGDSALHGDVVAGKKLTVGGTSNLHDTNVDGALDVTGDSALHGDVVADKKLTVGGVSLLKGDVTMEKKLTVKGAATFNDNVAMDRDLSVAGTSNLHDTNVDGALTVTGGASVGKDLTVGGNSLLRGTLDVDGFATFRSGASMGGNRLLEVADGRVERWSQDAVNGGQMWEMNRRLSEDIRNSGSRSAALAGLHPLDYDPSAPTSVAAAVGSYRGDTSLALGINHYFSEDVLLSLGSTIGKQPMVNLGVSFRLGRDAKKVSSRRQLRQELNEKDALLLSLLRRVEKLEQERR